MVSYREVTIEIVSHDTVYLHRSKLLAFHPLEEYKSSRASFHLSFRAIEVRELTSIKISYDSESAPLNLTRNNRQKQNDGSCRLN